MWHLTRDTATLLIIGYYSPSICSGIGYYDIIPALFKISGKPMDKHVVYKIMFFNQGKVYEIYAKEIFQSHLFGFIEAEELVFGERHNVVVDPGEERLREEFAGVIRTYIPMQAILRIDEVEREGIAKISEVTEKGHNIMPFPAPFYAPKDNQ